MTALTLFFRLLFISLIEFLFFIILIHFIPKEKYILSEDKIKHAGISLLLVIIFYVTCKSVLLSIVISVLLGILKEFIWDRLMNLGVFSWNDIYFNLIGIFISLIVLLTYFVIF